MDITKFNDKQLKDLYIKKTFVDEKTTLFTFSYSMLEDNNITLPVEVSETLIKLDVFFEENFSQFGNVMKNEKAQFYSNSFNANKVLKLKYSSGVFTDFSLEGHIDILFRNYQDDKTTLFKALFKYEDKTLYLANRKNKDPYLYEANFTNKNSFCILNFLSNRMFSDLNISLKEERDDYLSELRNIIDIIEF